MNALEWVFTQRTLAVFGVGRSPEDAPGLHKGMQSGVVRGSREGGEGPPHLTRRGMRRD